MEFTFIRKLAADHKPTSLIFKDDLIQCDDDIAPIYPERGDSSHCFLLRRSKVTVNRHHQNKLYVDYRFEKCSKSSIQAQDQCRWGAIRRNLVPACNHNTKFWFIVHSRDKWRGTWEG